MGGGFRKKNLAVVRARIQQVAEGAETIDDNLRQLLVRHDPCASCLALLSVETVKDNFEDLAALFGGPRLALALQLDLRLATQLKVESGKRKAENPPSNSQLREALAPLLAVLGADGAETPRAFESTTALKEARKEIASLKGAAERLGKEMAKREKAEAEAKKWWDKAKSAEEAIGQLRHRAEKAEADLSRHTRAAEAMANSKLEARLATEFAEWLGGRRAAMLREQGTGNREQGTGNGEPSNRQTDKLTNQRSELLFRAETAMAKQAQIDLAAGTRSALEDRLAAYEEVLSRCGGLIADALHPTEELIAVEKDLAAEVRRLRLLLHPELESAPSASPEESLVRAVNTAADHELPDLQHTVNRLCNLKIVTDEAKARLDERIRNRYAALYAKRGGPGLENGDGASAEYLLQCALEGQIPLIFLIDGHNTLYAIQSRYSRPQDHRGPPSEARDWLVNDIVQVFANAHNCRVIIVFDGPERTESNPAGNVKVIFSGGGGSDVEHRADDVLVDEARFLHEADPAMRMLLATNDNGLSSRAVAFGVRNIAPTALLAYLR